MRHINCWFIGGLAVLMTACRPSNVLDEATMENLLHDMHRIEGILYEEGYSIDKTDEIAAYYSVLLSKYGVTQAQFDSSLVWYTDHPTRFDKIYPRILERLQAEREAINQAEQTLQSLGQ